MIDLKIPLSDKQAEAIEILNDKTTTELLYGGGAGGGKSYLGCVWIITNCVSYPGTRWIMGRAVLKALKQSTLLTFFDILRKFGFVKGEDYTYNSVEGVFVFKKGSEVYLKDLETRPSDPEFDSLGSTEYTGGFIDEASQVSIKAKNIVTSRFRYKLDKYKLIPKLLIASNPYKNFLYTDFYKPWRGKALPRYRKFVPSLVTDNPFISKHYIENLKKLDKNSRERLLYGNWEYDDDPSKLFEYDHIVDMFTNTVEASKEKYITVDVARKGIDKTVIMYWEGLAVKRMWVYLKQLTNITEDRIKEKAEEYKVPRSHIIIDEDGIGGGCVDHIDGVKGFVNGSSPIIPKVKTPDQITYNYGNLKSQCYFYLAARVKQGEVSIYKGIPEKYKYMIMEELEQIKQRDPDNDGKLMVIKKEEIKQNIGRSPDFADALMMRMMAELKRTPALAWEFLD